MLAPSNFLEPYFAEENRHCNSNINDFVMDFDICSIVKTSHLGKSALVDANYCWTFHFPCYLWAWFLKFLLLNTSNSFFFHLLSKYFSWSQKTQWCQFETKSTISKIEFYNSCCWEFLMICSNCGCMQWSFKDYSICT